jgi:hypothetical protein
MPERFLVMENAKERDTTFWADARHEDLNKNEQGVYDMTAELKELPAFKRTMNVLFLIISGFYEVGPVDIGPLWNLVSVNPVEKWRFRFSVRTNKKLSEKFRLHTYIAYGLDTLKAKRFKFGAGGSYYFKRRPYHSITAEFQRDLQLPGQALLLASDDNIFLSLTTGGAANLRIYYDSYRFKYIKGWGFGLTLGVNVEHRRREVAGALTFDPIDPSIPDPKQVVTNEVGFSLKYAPNTKYYEGRSSNVPLITKHPIFEASYSYGIPGFLDAKYEYHKIGMRVFKRFFISPFGFGDSQLEGGYMFGRLPFPLLFVHRGNQTFFP